MPVANYEQYCEMLEKAREGRYAYPAINVTSTSTANAAIKAFADAKSDGIIQVSTGGGKFASGQGVGDMALGAISLAQHVHLVAEKYDILVALHTDHCHPQYIDSFLIPLIEETEKRRAQGLPNLFNSHMFDGSELPLDKNLALSKDLLERCAKSQIILEVETGVVGGEEDGVDNSGVDESKLYTQPEEVAYAYEELIKVSDKFMVAAAFGNVHGVYKPGNVKLTPKILKNSQEFVSKKFNLPHNTIDFVFHGGSGSSLEEIREAIGYGVIKMNIDTDMQYAFMTGVRDYFNDKSAYLKAQIGNPDGEDVPNKKYYDPRKWIREGENTFVNRLVKAFEDLNNVNTL